MSWRRAAAALGLAVLLAGACWPEFAEAQCAMCRTALGSPEGRKLVGAFQSGIVLLLAVPMAILGGGAWLVVRSRQRLERELQEDATPSEPPTQNG